MRANEAQREFNENGLGKVISVICKLGMGDNYIHFMVVFNLPVFNAFELDSYYFDSNTE